MQTNREVDRAIRNLAEAVFEKDAVQGAILSLGFTLDEEATRLQDILRRACEDFERFYVRRVEGPEERLLTAADVAKKYRLTRQWVYHCVELQKIAIKVGRRIRYPESKLKDFEKARRTSDSKGRGSKGFDLGTVMRNQSQDDTEQHKTILMLVK